MPQRNYNREHTDVAKLNKRAILPIELEEYQRVGQAFACYDPITSWLRLSVTGSDPCYAQSDGGDATLVTVDLAGFRRWIVNWPCVGAVSAALAG